MVPGTDPAVAASFLTNTAGAQTEPEDTTVAEDTTVGAATESAADTAADEDMTPAVADTAEVLRVGGRRGRAGRGCDLVRRLRQQHR
jgi:hypothetical protein